MTHAHLESLKLVTKYQGRLVPTVGGVILFGKTREKFFPDAWLQVGRFKGIDKKDIIDSQEIHTYPLSAVNAAIQFVQKHSMRALEIVDMKRAEVWNVPLIAIREAVINAIVHSDYAQQGAPIRIAIFDNRIEIENPGLIPFNLTLDDLYRGVSKLRNPVIARVFHELKLIERWGSGIRRMIETCLSAGLRAPVFEEIGVHFRVTLFTEQVGPRTLAIDSIDQVILELLEENEHGMSTKQIAEKITLTPRTTRSRLIELINKKLIVELGKCPTDPKKKYYLVK